MFPNSILNGMSGDFFWNAHDGTIDFTDDLAANQEKTRVLAEVTFPGHYLGEAIVNSLNQRDRLITALKNMTTLARQWERFSGTPSSTTPEIEAAFKLIKEVEAS